MVKKTFLLYNCTTVLFFLAFPFISFAYSAYEPLTEQDITEINNVAKAIKEHYVRPITNEKLLQGAISGMLASTDAHSHYLNQKTYNAFQFSMNNRYHGIGAIMTIEKGFVKVVSVFKNSPAEKARLKTNDYILAVNKKSVVDQPLEETIKNIKGKKGTKVTLTITNKTIKKKKNVTIIRNNIKIENIRSLLIEQGYGYVCISHFSHLATLELKKEIQALRSQSNGKLKGLILDLRGNPGGSLKSAIEISDMFLNSTKLKNTKLIVYTETNDNPIESKHFADPYDILKGAPLIVLIDENSASGSEIVAGALQFHKRAIIMGTKSFGKGSVQAIYPYKNNLGGAIKLTIARYRLPSGRTINKKNRVSPDILLDRFTLPQDNSEQLSLYQTNLNDTNLSNNTLYQKDRLVYDALKLLKGLQALNIRPT